MLLLIGLLWIPFFLLLVVAISFIGPMLKRHDWKVGFRQGFAGVGLILILCVAAAFTQYQVDWRLEIKSPRHDFRTSEIE